MQLIPGLEALVPNLEVAWLLSCCEVLHRVDSVSVRNAEHCSHRLHEIASHVMRASEKYSFCWFIQGLRILGVKRYRGRATGKMTYLLFWVNLTILPFGIAPGCTGNLLITLYLLKCLSQTWYRQCSMYGS